MQGDEHALRPTQAIYGNEADVSARGSRQSATKPYFDLIQSARISGQEYRQIWHLFAFRAEITAHLARFTHGVMHEPSPLSSGLRELIAAYTSYVNECEFCTRSHVAIAAELIGDEELVWSVLRDLESSALPEREKALLRYLAKVTRNLPSVTEDDAQTLRNAGWTDADIYYALTVYSTSTTGG